MSGSLYRYLDLFLKVVFEFDSSHCAYIFARVFTCILSLIITLIEWLFIKKWNMQPIRLS